MRRLVAEDDEGQYLEFKPAEERPSSLATSLAAFANADGGTLLYGVAERVVDGRKVHVIEGVPDVKLATDHLYTAAALCTPKYELAAPEQIAVDGTTILVVTVPEGLGQVYGVEGHYIAREGSYRRALTPDEIRSLLSRRGLFDYDRQPVPGATRADLDEARVRAYVARFPSGSQMGAETLLEARDLLVRPVRGGDAPLVPSVAGILLLGRDPQHFFPQARVAVVQVAAREPFQRREGLTQIGGEAIDDLRAPAVLSLLYQDVTADLPIQGDQLAVDREGRAHLGGPDTLLERAEERLVARRHHAALTVPPRSWVTHPTAVLSSHLLITRLPA